MLLKLINYFINQYKQQHIITLLIFFRKLIQVHLVWYEETQHHAIQYKRQNTYTSALLKFLPMFQLVDLVCALVTLRSISNVVEDAKTSKTLVGGKKGCSCWWCCCWTWSKCPSALLKFLPTFPNSITSGSPGYPFAESCAESFL